MENNRSSGKNKRKGHIWKWSLIYGVASLAIVIGIMVFITHAAEMNTPDYWPTTEWKTSTPEQQGMKSEVLAGLFDQLKDTHMHSMVIVRNGYIVAEAYNRTLNENSKVHVLSVTKSIISALVGIALDEGKLKNVHQTAAEFFPDWQAFADDPAKKQITLEHLMTMSSALKWDNTNENSTNQMMSTDIWAQYFINQPMDGTPGTKFVYSNGSAHLVSAILQQVLGRPTSEYADEKLFQPLGITDVNWPSDPSGTTIGAWGVHLTTREMAKFGLLYLNQGNWDGKQVVPKAWVKDSTTPYVSQEGPDGTKRGYGYLWWTRGLDEKVAPKSTEDEIYSAIGSGGQRIAVIPKYNIVVAITANNEDDAFFSDRLIDDYILKSIESSKPIKDNPQGQALLKQKIEAFKQTSD